MKRIIPVFLALALLTGCGSGAVEPVRETKPVVQAPVTAPEAVSEGYTSRFDRETAITLSDDGITVNGGGETSGVFTSRDIVYYEDRLTYDSGNPYGEGKQSDMHTAQEAQGHLVVNITEPGAYRVSGKLDAGQIRVDLGKKADSDPDAVVELFLDGADITCTVAPAILFENVYECDGDWDADTATALVDTTAAGAVLVVEGENTVNGSYVAKIYKDKEGEKKLWKQDGAIYSYMSMNIEGTGTLNLNARNEGLGSELHLTVNGGNINICADNDGINTNEDGVSVTTINGGFLNIVAGMGQEGDGIDSNGYLVINGGTVISAAHPASDAGLDSDLGSYINGGTVVALGSTMDWAESESDQVTMNLQFASYQAGGTSIAVTREDGTVIFTYEPEYARQYQGAILSCDKFRVGESYLVYAGDAQMMYTGTDVGRGGPFGGGRAPGGFEGGMPGEFEGRKPEGFKDEMRPMPDGGPDRMPPEWNGEMPEGFDFPGGEGVPEGPGNTVFYMADKVNAFSGLRAVE